MTEQPLFRDSTAPQHMLEGTRKGVLKIACLQLVSLQRLTAVHLSGSITRKNKHEMKNLNIGCWNVRTLLDREGSGRPERRTALVAKELERYNIDIAALSETRISEEGNLEEIGSGYVFYWFGKPKDKKREFGVGFAIKKRLVSMLEELPTGINERIMTLRLPLTHHRYATCISVYAPTMTNSPETISSFYENLKSTIQKVPADDKIILLGDFNARVGTDFETWAPLGRFGLGNMNENGLRLLQICTELDLAIGNTHFRTKSKYKTTWMHPRSKQWHLLDYVIVRRRDLQDLFKVKALRGANCWTDHRLVRAKVHFVVRQKRRFGESAAPKKINVAKLKDKESAQELARKLNEIDFDGTWDCFKDRVYESASETLGFQKRKHQDWFDENNVEINELLDRKNKLWNKLLHDNLPESEKEHLKKSLSEVKAEVQRELRSMKNTWWQQKATEIQSAADMHDSKSLYDKLKEVYGPTQSKVTPMKSKDGSNSIRDPDQLMDRWKEHYTDLFHNPSSVDLNFINELPQNDIITEMDSVPNCDEVKEAIAQMRKGKSPGFDGIPIEVIKCGGDLLVQKLTNVVEGFWNGTPVHQDWKDSIMVSLYKGKGKKNECGNYRGISLLSVAGKVFARVLLNRLEKFICSPVLPETQCGFRAGRGTTDMIFTARQIIEKCIEHRLDLFQVFIDLTKAFDTVNREALWKILEKLGCSSHFVDMIRQLHDGMKAKVNFNGSLSSSIPVENGVKQGDILAPTLFSIFFATTLTIAFKDCDTGVYLRYRTSGGLFNLRRFNAKSKTFPTIVRDLLYADDADLVAHSEHDLQSIIDRFSKACTIMGLTISLSKTKVMFTPAPGNVYYEPNITVDGTHLSVVDKFVYLGSTISRDGYLDEEILNRIQQASSAFGKLETRLWTRRGISLKIKLSVYEACVITTLLYASETWTTYRRNIKLLERFHQNCLRHILGISWESHTPDSDVLKQADSLTIEARITRNRMRWVGHVVRQDDTRLPKQLLYGELTGNTRPPYKPRKRFKDCLKSDLSQLKIEESNWESRTADRSNWRKLLYDGTQTSECSRLAHAELKRAARKMENIAPPSYRGSRIELTCGVCGRVTLSKAGLTSHMKSHSAQTFRSDIYTEAIRRNQQLVCEVCDKVCKSKSGLTRHRETHGIIPAQGRRNQNLKICHICGKSCRSLSGLMSHLRAHERGVQV